MSRLTQSVCAHTAARCNKVVCPSFSAFMSVTNGASFNISSQVSEKHYLLSDRQQLTTTSWIGRAVRRRPSASGIDIRSNTVWECTIIMMYEKSDTVDKSFSTRPLHRRKRTPFFFWHDGIGVVDCICTCDWENYRFCIFLLRRRQNVRGYLTAQKVKLYFSTFIFEVVIAFTQVKRQYENWQSC